MEEIILGKNKEVKLFVNISSDAMVLTYVYVDNKIIRRSSLNNFNVSLGNSNDLLTKKTSVVCQFMVADNIDGIFKNTIVTGILKINDKIQEFTFTNDRITGNDNFFVSYLTIMFKKD